MTLYFAYGSNLSKKQMRKRCPGASPYARATLHGWRWLIGERGYCTIAPHARRSVYGALYLLTPADERALDLAEGVGSGCYGKFMLPVVCDNGETARALVYVDPLTRPGAPSARYLRRCAAGARAWSLPRHYVEQMEATATAEEIDAPF